MSSLPARPFKEVIQAEWTDYNGHLNEAYYVLIFSHATDVFMKSIGIDPEAPERRTINSVYTLETHVRYLRECKEGDEVEVATRLIAFDAKRYHCLHEMYLSGSDQLLATAEMVLLHIDMTGPRSAPFPEEVSARLVGRLKQDEALEPSQQLCGAMGLKKK